VGDSISAGYGNLGTAPCPFSVDAESAYSSYGMVVGRMLNAETSVVAVSGWGMIRDLNGDSANVLPNVYANTMGLSATPAWTFARKADAVLINLGTNDSAVGDPGVTFETGYIAFLNTVRGANPGAWIFLTIGTITSGTMLTTMRQHLANVVAAFGDPKVMKIDLPHQNTAGCGNHPDAAQDQLMANTLAPVMKSALGW
jgi:hypothetical protein